MENQKSYRTPSGTLARMQVVHFGKIMFNMQFIPVVIMAASILSFILPAIYYILLICALFLSLFTLLANETFMASWAGGETLVRVMEALYYSWTYTVPIVAVMSIASIVCLSFDKREKHIGRIVTSAIIFVLALVLLFFKLVNSGVFE